MHVVSFNSVNCSYETLFQDVLFFRRKQNFPRSLTNTILFDWISMFIDCLHLLFKCACSLVEISIFIFHSMFQIT